MVDKNRFLVYNEDMKTDIFNYLNLVNPKLGKLYKTGRFNPLPEDFVLTEDLIKERLFLSQIEPTAPKFVYSEKSKIKKYLKNSQKNIKKLIKNQEKIHFLSNFSQKFQNYLNLRLKLTSLILKEFRKQDFNEGESLNEIMSLNPILGNQLIDIFKEDFNLDISVEEIEKQYKLTYQEKLKLIEKKTKQKTRKKKEQVEQLNKVAEKSTSKSKETAKKQEKVVSKAQKTEKINTKPTKTTSKSKTTTTKSKEI